MNATVEQRLRQIIAGDRQAAAWLYDTFAPRLFRRLGRRYAHQAGLDPNDLLRDTFAFFFQNDARLLATFLRRHAGRTPTVGTLERFLWTQACSVAQAHPRLQSSREAAPHDEMDAASSDAPEGIEEAHLERLDRCLLHADAQRYLSFKLCYADGLTAEQAATVVGETPSDTETPDDTETHRDALHAALHQCVERLGISTAISPEDLLYALAAAERDAAPALPQDALLTAYRNGTLVDDRKIKLALALGQSPVARQRLAHLAAVALPEPKLAVRRQVFKRLSRGASLAAPPTHTTPPWPLIVGSIGIGALLVGLLWLSGFTRLLFPAALPTDLTYDVTLHALAGSEQASEPGATAQEPIAVRSHTELRIAITPRGAGIENVVFGLYRRTDGVLQKVRMEGSIRIEAVGNGAVFTGRADDLAGTAAGEHALYAVVARPGDLPIRRPFRTEEPTAAMADGQRRLAYPLPRLLVTN